MAKRRFFGTDGIRGRVGEEPITPERILKLGWAAGRVLCPDGGKVLIGKDTRISGYLLESALEAGLSAAGANISLLGPMPTPGIAYLTRTARARAGIVISASHNAYQDNGIKFFAPTGMKLDDVIEAEIEKKMEQPMQVVDPGVLGKAGRFPDAAGRYIEFCKSTLRHGCSLDGIHIVVDCANGAAYQIAPSVFAELGAKVTAIANQPDGFNINRDCGSTNIAFLQDAVNKNHADLGIALDGDGDRLIMVDSNGNVVDGDGILYIVATHRQSNGRMQGGVVGTLMTNLGLEQAFERIGVPFDRAAVGDRYVLNVMVQKGWSLGGETSGHIICLDATTTGDGIIAALQVLDAMVQQQRTVAELCAGMERYPQTMINVRLPGERPLADVELHAIDLVRDALQAARSELADRGRVVLRPSGTEPLIRVMVEGDDAQQVARISSDLAAAVEDAARNSILSVA